MRIKDLAFDLKQITSANTTIVVKFGTIGYTHEMKSVEEQSLIVMSVPNDLHQSKRVSRKPSTSTYTIVPVWLPIGSSHAILEIVIRRVWTLMIASWHQFLMTILRY